MAGEMELLLPTRAVASLVFLREFPKLLSFLRPGTQEGSAEMTRVCFLQLLQ